MLVLTRHVDQSIIITKGGDIIKFKILDIIGSQIRIGIDAPRDISVDREEIYERKMLEK